MNIQSLATKTELLFGRMRGEVHDRGYYVVVRTPSNPGYHWGNFIVFPSGPGAEDFQEWVDISKHEFRDIDSVRHIAFTWDDGLPSENLDQFLESGFSVDQNLVLATSSVTRPRHINTDVEVKVIESEDDWERVTLNQITMNESYDPAGFEKFKRAQMADYRRIFANGHGHWFGAWLDGNIVGSLGLVCDGSLGRYQSVVTQPEYRCRGICARIVYDAAQWAFNKRDVKTLVMVADANYHAARIYQSVGFNVVEQNFSMSWWKT